MKQIRYLKQKSIEIKCIKNICSYILQLWDYFKLCNGMVQVA